MRVGKGEALDRVDTRNADAPEIRKCRLGIVTLGIEPTREDIGALERLAGALPRV